MPSPKADVAAPATALVRELAEILNETGLSEIEVERDGLRVRVARSLISASVPTFVSPAPVPSVPVPLAAPAAESTTRTGETVTSPMVGTVYLQAQPGTPPFVTVGATVAAGQTLLLVEAMKTMNPITAPRAGTVLEMLVSDAQPVEFGEPLVVIG
jgi:acetyl-CoA carboxylase biotin carboxyl carrier protein